MAGERREGKSKRVCREEVYGRGLSEIPSIVVEE